MKLVSVSLLAFAILMPVASASDDPQQQALEAAGIHVVVAAACANGSEQESIMLAQRTLDRGGVTDQTAQKMFDLIKDEPTLAESRAVACGLLANIESNLEE